MLQKRVGAALLYKPIVAKRTRFIVSLTKRADEYITSNHQQIDIAQTPTVMHRLLSNNMRFANLFEITFPVHLVRTYRLFLRERSAFNTFYRT